MNRSITVFENLPNETIFEIFEYLDYPCLYEAFRSLNKRFDNVIIDPNLPVKINFSMMSKSAAQDYYRNTIQFNINRIISFKISNAIMYDFVLQHMGSLSQFHRIKAVILDNIEWKHAKLILNELGCLPLLSSLVISIPGIIYDENSIYHQIFGLRALKYCKLSWMRRHSNVLPICNNDYSPIKHLVITGTVYINELDSLLSYVPQLRRLSLLDLFKSENFTNDIRLRSMNHLTHFSCQIRALKFIEFTEMLMNISKHIRILCITSYVNNDWNYVDAKQWEQLIVQHLPCLQIFDIRLQYTLLSSNTENETIMIPFRSSFWTERQWFFDCCFSQNTSNNEITLYSTNPYRRKDYLLSRQYIQCRNELTTVKRIFIEDDQTIADNPNYFPNATELIFNDTSYATNIGLINILNHILPLNKLVKLAFDCDHFSIDKVMEILCYAPNLQTLTLKTISYLRNSNVYLPIKESNAFGEASKANNVKELICQDHLELAQIQLLVELCPQLKCLTIKLHENKLQSLIEFLLDPNNSNTRQLCSLCLLDGPSFNLREMHGICRSKDYILKDIDHNICLWR